MGLGEKLKPLEQHEQVLGFKASRERLASDPYRPAFHFSPPEGFMNAPNGLCRWQGLHHLFYQFRPDGVDRVHRGHAASEDLVHWRDLPIALYPDREHHGRRNPLPGNPGDGRRTPGPAPLREQLDTGGRLVIPVGERHTRLGPDEFRVVKDTACRFVDLIGEHGWN